MKGAEGAVGAEVGEIVEDLKAAVSRAVTQSLCPHPNFGQTPKADVLSGSGGSVRPGRRPGSSGQMTATWAVTRALMADWIRPDGERTLRDSRAFCCTLGLF